MQSENRHGVFEWTVRVYYEDTDAAGIVYYANYLKFFERCRTEWLRTLGIDQCALAATQARQFVVVGAAVEYLRPARLDDVIRVQARIARLRRASLEFDQHAWRGDELLARAEVKVACVKSVELSPAPLPADLRRLLLTL